MTENEAIKELETSIDLAKMCTQNYERKNEIQCYEMAINALEDVQQYRALEKHLSDMFGGSLSLKMCVDELERILVKPDSPHPMNAKILTYQEAADWEAYRAIGTPEECHAAVEKQIPKKPKHTYIKHGKHTWKKDKNGEIDDFAWDFDYHNGVVCEVCGETVCVHCNPNYDKLEDCEENIYSCPVYDKEVYYNQKYCECGQKLITIVKGGGV